MARKQGGLYRAGKTDGEQSLVHQTKVDPSVDRRKRKPVLPTSDPKPKAAAKAPANKAAGAKAAAKKTGGK